jgi:hypothetical protein
MKMIFIMIVSCIVVGTHEPSDLETIRDNYSLAGKNKSLCKEMIDKLKDCKEPVRLAYLGAFQAVWAKHTSNPFEKLKTFRTGKKNIEESVLQSPSNAEIRFIRLSIQLNAPKLLGYSDAIEEDKSFIMNNRSSVKSETLKGMIDECIK